MKHGYKNALRNRMPEYLDLALRWCRAKNRYIEYVYEKYIKKEDISKRKDTIKIVYGLKPGISIWDVYIYLKSTGMKEITLEKVKNAPKSLRRMSFNMTVLADNDIKQNENLLNYWSIVSTWVDWFKTNWIFIQNTMQTSIKLGRTDEELDKELKEKFLSNVPVEIQNKLSDYLIKYIKKNE